MPWGWEPTTFSPVSSSRRRAMRTNTIKYSRSLTVTSFRNGTLYLNQHSFMSKHSTTVRLLNPLWDLCMMWRNTDKNEEVMGIADPDISEKLQLKIDLTLTKSIEMASSAELVKSQNSHSPSHSTTVKSSLYAVSRCGMTQQQRRRGSGCDVSSNPLYCKWLTYILLHGSRCSGSSTTLPLIG